MTYANAGVFLGEKRIEGSYTRPMTRRRTTALLRLVAAWAALAAILACGGSGANREPTEEEQARSEALRGLEAHLSEATTYGEGPDGQALADAVRHTLAPGDGVAVRVIPGTPRNTVVLVRYRSTDGYQDLREIPQADRNGEIDRILEAIDHRYSGQGDNLAIGIRGALFYGALGVRMAGRQVEYHTGSVVSLSPLDPLLTATPGPDATTPLVLSEQVEGTVVGPDGAPPTYNLNVEQEGLYVVQTVTNRYPDGSPFMVLCRGNHPGMLCEANEVEEIDGFFNDGLDELSARVSSTGRRMHYQAYRLVPGVYTVGMLPNCDWEGPCAAAGTPFTLMATTPRPNVD